MGIALQLYSIRDDYARDFEGTLKTVAEGGYEGVEFEGYHGRSAESIMEVLEDFSKVTGTHISLGLVL